MTLLIALWDGLVAGFLWWLYGENRLWVVGRHFDKKEWELVGVFTSRARAEEACEGQSEDYFIGPVKRNHAVHETLEWPDSYYPNLTDELYDADELPSDLADLDTAEIELPPAVIAAIATLKAA
jgi:hypothetical protein